MSLNLYKRKMKQSYLFIGSHCMPENFNSWATFSNTAFWINTDRKPLMLAYGVQNTNTVLSTTITFNNFVFIIYKFTLLSFFETWTLKWPIQNPKWTNSKKKCFISRSSYFIIGMWKLERANYCKQEVLSLSKQLLEI